MHRRAVLAGLATATLAGFAATPAQACSTNWKKGYSPREVRARANVMRVEGTWTVEELAGERRTDADGIERVYGPRFLGTLTSKSGRRKWRTIHEPILETGVMCLDVLYAQFNKPEAAAKGTFWIERGTRRGRHLLLDWEGEYDHGTVYQAAPAVTGS